MDNAFKYIEEIGGLDTEDAYVSFFMACFLLIVISFIKLLFVNSSRTTLQMKY